MPKAAKRSGLTQALGGMRQTAIVLASLAYLFPLGWQVALRLEPVEPGHGLLQFVTTGGSLLLALGLSVIATALLIAARRDFSQPLLGKSAFTRAETAFVAAPAVAVTLLALVVLGTLAAA